MKLIPILLVGLCGPLAFWVASPASAAQPVGLALSPTVMEVSAVPACGNKVCPLSGTGECNDQNGTWCDVDDGECQTKECRTPAAEPHG